MNPLGKHIFAELHGCDRDKLNDLDTVERVMRAAAEVVGVRVVAATFHAFSPQGVTGVLVIEESHLAIHTWPEACYAAFDFYTCGDTEPQRAVDLIAAELEAARTIVASVVRGAGASDSGQ